MFRKIEISVNCIFLFDFELVFSFAVFPNKGLRYILFQLSQNFLCSVDEKCFYAHKCFNTIVW